MTALPIRLELAQVSLIDTNHGKTGIRWTLGPTWYDDHQYDEGIQPYYDDDNLDIELSSGAAHEPARNWATRMIAETTNYRVVGWNDTVPVLEKENHYLEFWTVAGVRASYAVDGTQVPWIIGRLGDPDNVIVIPNQEPSNTTTYIPTRSIATINHTIHRDKITNA